jgi:anti-sigma B factor antagonist
LRHAVDRRRPALTRNGKVTMSISARGHPDHATVARWQHKLASRIVIQAFKDLRSRHGLAEDRASAREFLAGSAMLRYWCLVGSLDLHQIIRRVRRDGTLRNLNTQERRMELNERIVGEVAFVHVVGSVFGSRGGPKLSDKVRSLAQQGFRRVLVDLGRVTYMDSSGLGDLIEAYTSMKKAGGALKLMHVETRLRDLLTITKLVTVFETFDNEVAAIESFTPAA